MLYQIGKSIKQFIHRRKVKNQCKFGDNVTIDSRSAFEGNNKLSDNVTFLNSQIGYASYIGAASFIKNTQIGRYSCIASDVITVTGNHPSTGYVSIHPAFYSTLKQCGITYVIKNRYPDFKYIDSDNKISIVIGNDVWIGNRVTILEHVTINDGAIIGAGAVVTKDIPPYAIVGGVPAKIIKYRFPDEIRKKLLEFRWWDKDEDWIKMHVDIFEDIDDFMKYI